MANMRSPNYPAIGLLYAEKLIKSMWAKEKKTAVPFEVAAKAIGYSSVSGPSRTALAALKKYGLLQEDTDGMVRLSEVAMRIIHSDSADRLQALREAALKPSLFRELYETKASASNDALKSYLITRLNFSEIGAQQCIQAFRETIEVAKLNETSDNTLTETSRSEAMSVGIGEVRTTTGTKNLRTFSWPLSPETTARLEIMGNEELTSAHIDALTLYLEVAKKLLKSTPKS